MKGRINFSVVRALAKRDLLLYFSNPTGYVFITLFIFISAAAAFWQDRFFLDNLANLDQLNRGFPYLLLFFIPALTMGVWSEERKLGTEELLLTLPARDIEVVLGKYVATLGIYSVSLVLALSYVIVLFWLGGPDLGLMFSNYLGYWLVGAALIAVGMLASLLTANATIGFILGAAFCGAIIALDTAVGAFSDTLGRTLESLGVFRHFEDFAKGVVSLSGILYFLSVGGFFLYLNVLLLSRRHWPHRADGYPMAAHHWVRAVAIALILISVNVLVGRLTLRLDATAEGLHSLSGETRALLAGLPADRPVFIQAFISPTVPELFVQTRANVIGLLQEIDAIGGSKVEVLIEDTEPFTEAARNAREKFGILPRAIRDVASARSEFQEVFLGVAFTSGAEEQVIPFFDIGLPAEYEVVRSIRVVARSERKRIGVVKTMVNLFGGMDYNNRQFQPMWSVLDELRKQYELVEVDPEAGPIDQVKVDALLVPHPSSLQTDEMNYVSDLITNRTPALLLVDPLPAVSPYLSPSEWAGDSVNPYIYPPGTARPGPRGNVRTWIRTLGVDWEPTRIVWDTYNPHPELSHMPSEIVFVGPGNENPDSFNRQNPMTAQLQEVVFQFPGYLEPLDNPEIQFEPLLKSSKVSGTIGYFGLARSTPVGFQMNPNPIRRQDNVERVLAARVRWTTGGTGQASTANLPADAQTPPASAPAGAQPPAVSASASVEPRAQQAAQSNGGGAQGQPAPSQPTAAPSASADSSLSPQPSSPQGEREAEGPVSGGDRAADPAKGQSTDKKNIDVIVVADLDLISDQFFQIRQIGAGNLIFDNVTFFLNAIDTLVGDDSFVALRSRRPKHRTLERVGAQTRRFIDQRTADEDQARTDAEEALKAAQARLDARVKEIQGRDDLDTQAKEIMARNVSEVENRRLQVLQANIEAERDAKISASEENMEAQIRRIQNTIKTFAILLPPVPVFLLGVAIFVRRAKREREGAIAARRLKE
jgi:ABC-2 type transport system permease protein